jgi:hypothetical protein
MNIRYLSVLVLVITAGFLVVATQAFGVATATWLTFAVAIGLTVVSLCMAGSLESIAQRVIGGVGAIVGAWTIVASLLFA